MYCYFSAIVRQVKEGKENHKPACFNAGKLKQRKHNKTMECLVCQESDTLVLGQEVHSAVNMKNQNPQIGAETMKRSPGSVMSVGLACAGRCDECMGMIP